MSYEQRPYVLTRAMYVPSVSARDFPAEEASGRDIVGMWREEIEELESEGVASIQTDKIWVNPDCGFGGFSDRPVATPEITAAKLRAIVEAVAVHQAPRRA